MEIQINNCNDKHQNTEKRKQNNGTILEQNETLKEISNDTGNNNSLENTTLKNDNDTNNETYNQINDIEKETGNPIILLFITMLLIACKKRKRRL